MIVVPAGAAHGSEHGRGTLEVMSVHPVAEMETEWLEEEGGRTPPGYRGHPLGGLHGGGERRGRHR